MCARLARQISHADTSPAGYIPLIALSSEWEQAFAVPVLPTGPAIRPHGRSIVERFRPSTVVTSRNEIHPKAQIHTLGQV